jgi:hypothetical protein
VDFYEQLVHFYLTAIEKCLVIPQVEILKSPTGESWVAYPDFLALDFSNRLIQVIEVTKGWKATSTLAPKLKQQHRTYVEDYIKSSTLQGELRNFSLLWRFFVRNAEASRLEVHPDLIAYKESGGHVRIEYLEQVFDKLRDQMP